METRLPESSASPAPVPQLPEHERNKHEARFRRALREAAVGVGIFMLAWWVYHFQHFVPWSGINYDPKTITNFVTIQCEVWLIRKVVFRTIEKTKSHYLLLNSVLLVSFASYTVPALISLIFRIYKAHEFRAGLTAQMYVTIGLYLAEMMSEQLPLNSIAHHLVTFLMSCYTVDSFDGEPEWKQVVFYQMYLVSESLIFFSLWLKAQGKPSAPLTIATIYTQPVSIILREIFIFRTPLHIGAVQTPIYHTLRMILVYEQVYCLWRTVVYVNHKLRPHSYDKAERILERLLIINFILGKIRGPGHVHGHLRRRKEASDAIEFTKQPPQDGAGPTASAAGAAPTATFVQIMPDTACKTLPQEPEQPPADDRVSTQSLGDRAEVMSPPTMV